MNHIKRFAYNTNVKNTNMFTIPMLRIVNRYAYMISFLSCMYRQVKNVTKINNYNANHVCHLQVS